jgi:hypothetical protein
MFAGESLLLPQDSTNAQILRKIGASVYTLDQPLDHLRAALAGHRVLITVGVTGDDRLDVSAQLLVPTPSRLLWVARLRL